MQLAFENCMMASHLFRTEKYPWIIMTAGYVTNFGAKPIKIAN